MVWSLHYLFSAICHVARIVNFKTSLYTIYYLVDIFSKELFKKIQQSCCIYMSKSMIIRMWISEGENRKKIISIFCTFIPGNIFKCSIVCLPSLQIPKGKYFHLLCLQELNHLLLQFLRFNLIFIRWSHSDMHIGKHCKTRTDCVSVFAINRYT